MTRKEKKKLRDRLMKLRIRISGCVIEDNKIYTPELTADDLLMLMDVSYALLDGIMPDKDEKYYSIRIGNNGTPYVVTMTWTDSTDDRLRFEAENVFMAEESANTACQVISKVLHGESIEDKVRDEEE